MPDDELEKPNAEPTSHNVNTGGGANVEGDVTTSGDFIGRDKNTTFVGKLIVSRLAWVLGFAAIAQAKRHGIGRTT